MEFENSPKVLELQNRVKVLQGKLDKQKEQTKVLEESLKTRPKLPEVSLQEGGPKAGGESSAAADKSPVVDTKVRVCIPVTHYTWKSINLIIL